MPEPLETQLFVGSEPTPARFQRVENDPIRGMAKKPSGGLWTSTYDAETGSAWVQWCIAEDFGVPDAGWQSWLLEPEPTARVLTIDSLPDLLAALDRYGDWLDAQYHGLGRILDFEKLADDYDAVHLTAHGQYETHLSFPDGLYGWDAESTLWLRWAVTRVSGLGRCRFFLESEQEPEWADASGDDSGGTAP